MPSTADLEAEIVRLNKVVYALMNRAERNASTQGSEFNLFQTTIMLEDQVQNRTEKLASALQENEKITRALREAQNNYRILLENSPESIHEIDMQGRILSMSKAGLRMHECTEESEMIGRLYLGGVHTADRERVAELLERAYAGETCHFEFNVREVEGRVLKSCFVPIRNSEGAVKNIMGITEDITERKKVDELIRTLAFNDALTHLPNRRLLHDRLKQAMVASTRSGLYGAIMFLDLDNFKPLNDQHGHETGDLLLIEVARRLTNCVREVDTVARIGGDEFVVMLQELDVDMYLSASHAGNVSEKIRVELAKPYLLRQEKEDNTKLTVQHQCTASIGVKLFVNHEISQEEVIKYADIAMYQAKEQGRNRVVISDLNSTEVMKRICN